MVRLLDNLDGFLHWLLDGYINSQRPGRGVLQHAQWRVCQAFELAYERDN